METKPTGQSLQAPHSVMCLHTGGPSEKRHRLPELDSARHEIYEPLLCFHEQGGRTSVPLVVKAQGGKDLGFNPTAPSSKE